MDDIAPVDTEEHGNALDPATTERALAAYRGLTQRGMDPETALGYAANFVQESRADPTTRPGDAGNSHGIAMWNGDRLARYQVMHGHNPEQGGLDEQLDHVMWENQGPEAENYKNVMLTPGGAPAKAAAVSAYWERPKDVVPEQSRRSWIAQQLIPSAAADELTRAKQAPQTEQPASGPPPDLTARITAARKAGYDDATIFDAISKSPKWGGSVANALKAGRQPGDIAGFLGLKLPTSEAADDDDRDSAETTTSAAGDNQRPLHGDPAVQMTKEQGDALKEKLKSIQPEPPVAIGDNRAALNLATEGGVPDVAPAAGPVPDSVGEKVYGAAKSAWENTQPLLDPKAQSVLDNIQKAGGVKGYLAALGSTAAMDLDYLNKAGAAAYGGTQTFINSIAAPLLGEQGARDLTAMATEAFMGSPHPTGIPGVPRLTAAESAAMKEARGYAEAPLTVAPGETPEQAAGRTERENREAWQADMANRMSQPGGAEAPLAITGPETPSGPSTGGGPSTSPSAPRTPPPGRPITPEAARPLTPEAAAVAEEEDAAAQPATAPKPPEQQAAISELQNIGQGKPAETPPAQPTPGAAPVSGLPLFGARPSTQSVGENPAPRTPPHVPVHEAPDGSGAMTDLSDEDYAAIMNRSAPTPPVQVEGEHPDVAVKTAPEETAAPEPAVVGNHSPNTTPFIPVPKEPKRLIPFLQQGVKINEGTPSERTVQYGLKDRSISHEGGDLLAIMGGHQVRPGFINNTSGEPLDNAGLRAYQAGYFDHRPDINELLDAIHKDHNGIPQYSAYDLDAAQAHNYAKERNDEISQLAAKHGLPLTGIKHDEFMAEVAKREAASAPPAEPEFQLPPISQEEIDYWNNLPEGQFQAGQKLPLYSPVERAVEALPQARGTGHQMFAQIAKTPGVKPEEMQWLGLEDWMKGQGHVTKQQIADYVRANALNVQEVVRRDRNPETEPARLVLDTAAQQLYGRNYRDLSEPEKDAAYDAAEKLRPKPTRYSQYKLPGGENYREMLITMPPEKTQLQNLEPEIRALGITKPYDNISANDLENAGASEELMNRWHTALSSFMREEGGYRSPHWEEPNVLAHVRFDERTAPDGARVLMVHEVQSDWHQAGRKEGYAPPGGPADRFHIVDQNGHSRGDFSTREEAQNYLNNPPDFIDPARSQIWPHEGNVSGVPDAPFKTSWPSLVMKRIMKYAVDNGFDRVAWAPGDVQAERYDLSKQIKALHYTRNADGTYLLAPESLHGQEVPVNDGRPIEANKLADYVGKDIAEKIIADKRGGVQTIEGDGLKIGGSGMRAFYDNILPKETSKIIGKFGGKVGKSEVGVNYPDREQVKPDAQATANHAAEWQSVVDRIATAERAPGRGHLQSEEERRLYDELDRIHAKMVDETMARGARQPVHSVDITPEMRAAIQTQGLPLFAGRRLPIPPQRGEDLFGGTRAQPATRTPEPTIRNDVRQQVMPGMEPSAHQAQAASDAAGPKPNQLPPDQGLFAPKPPEAQPELPVAAKEPEVLPPRVSKWAGHGDKPFTDMLQEAPTHGQDAAANWVFRKGRETGHEHIAVVDNRTGEIVHAGTSHDPGQVWFQRNGDYGEDGQYTVHHNHPNDTAVSHADSGMLSNPDISHVVAHTADGNTTITSLAPKVAQNLTQDRLGVIENNLKIQKVYQAALARAKDVLLPMIQDGKVSLPEGNQLWGDLANRFLQAVGMIDYKSTIKVPPAVKAAFDAKLKEQKLVPDDRHTESVRPEERTASLPTAVREQPRQEPAGGEGGAGNRAGEPQGSLLAGEGRLGLADDEARGENVPDTLRAGRRLPLSATGTSGDVLGDKKGLDRAAAEIKAAFSPTSLKGAQKMEQMLRAHGGEEARSYAQSAHALEKVRNAFDHLPISEQDNFTHLYETGQRVAPELQPVMDALRSQIDTWTRKVQSLGRGYLANAIQDYLGRVYGNYNEWAAGLPNPTAAEMADAANASKQAKSPLLGSKNFLKQRVFPTLRDAMAAGLEPVTHNTIDMQLIKLREMQKFYHGTKLADAMKDNGIARWIPAGAEREASAQGLVRLDDRVFQPRLQGDANAAGYGRLEPGNWYAPESAARLFNNYMSRGLAGQSVIYDAFRGANNALNSLQLGLSGFHATFVALDTAISKVALGMQQISEGKIGKGAANVLFGWTPATVVQTLRRGSQLGKAFLDPASATPEMRQIAQDMATAGGRMNMDQFYRTTGAGSFFKNLSDLKNPLSPFHQAAQMFRDEPSNVKKVLAVPLRIAGRVIDTINEPLMGKMVPAAKRGVFADMAHNWNESHPNATPEERSAALIKMWDSVDNRMGQLVYSNLFWNKVQKDIAFIATRSVGWNLGTVREIGGAGVDGARFINDAAHGRRPEFTTRMAYTMAMPVVTAIYGAILTALATGKPPQDYLDYFFPPSGNQDPNGQPQRRVIPGYIKDVIEYSRAPVQTVLNKTSPLIETLSELHNNKDYYGGTIYDAARDSALPAYGDYILNQALPFSWRGWNKLEQQKAPPMDQALAFWGIQPAPQSITNPEKEEAWQKRQDAIGDKKRNREPNRVHFFTPNTASSPAP